MRRQWERRGEKRGRKERMETGRNKKEGGKAGWKDGRYAWRENSWLFICSPYALSN